MYFSPFLTGAWWVLCEWFFTGTTTAAGVVIIPDCDTELSFLRTCAMRFLAAHKSDLLLPAVAPMLTAGIVTAITIGPCTIAFIVDDEDVPTATAEFTDLARNISARRSSSIRSGQFPGNCYIQNKTNVSLILIPKTQSVLYYHRHIVIQSCHILVGFMTR